MCSPTRVLHGTTNIVMYLQFTESTLSSKIRAEVLHVLLWWLDNIQLHSKTTLSHLDTVQLFFMFCAWFNLKLNSANCILFIQFSVAVVSFRPIVSALSPVASTEHVTWVIWRLVPICSSLSAWYSECAILSQKVFGLKSFARFPQDSLWESREEKQTERCSWYASPHL